MKARGMRDYEKHEKPEKKIMEMDALQEELARREN
jgi:hypothetical protein